MCIIVIDNAIPHILVLLPCCACLQYTFNVYTQLKTTRFSSPTHHIVDVRYCLEFMFLNVFVFHHII